MFGHRLEMFERGTPNRIGFAVTTPMVLWAGWSFFVDGARSIVQRRSNMWTLICLGKDPPLASLYSVLGMPLAAGLLYRFTGWLLSLMIAALAMSLSSVSVIGNLMQLRHSGKAAGPK